MKNKFEISEKDFIEIKNARSSYNKLPVTQPIRKDGETFWDFIEQNHQIMNEIKDTPKVKYLGKQKPNKKK